jgi:uncharacterized phage protein (TIGR01671 family)
MREIKFRQRTQSDRFHYWGFLDGGFYAPSLTNESLSDALEHSQQFTGLKDKNGKEIYEGDFIRCPERVKYPASGGKVTQYERTERIEWTDKESGFGINQWEVSEYDFEIIGNIYENPELLK